MAGSEAFVQEFVKCDQVLGVHYDTFPPIQIDHQEAAANFAFAGKKLHLLQIGQSREIPGL